MVEQAPASSGVTLFFEVDDVNDSYRELLDLGVRFDTEPEDMPWLWREARLRDPDGHQLCLFHAGENRKNPPWRIGD